ncbi:MAG: DUF1493 family protein [Thermoguttaceae bacterium]|jgi:hypothetical protein
MPDRDAILAEVVKLLRGFVGPRKRIAIDTTLFVDLGFYGDDAGAFLGEFSRRFHVDMSMFCFDPHFLPEGYSCLETIMILPAIWRRYSASGRKNANLIPITVRQLVEAASIGRWPAEWSRGTGKTDEGLKEAKGDSRE